MLVPFSLYFNGASTCLFWNKFWERISWKKRGKMSSSESIFLKVGVQSINN